MAELNRINAIKHLRTVWRDLVRSEIGFDSSLSLKLAKDIVDTIAPYVIDTNAESFQRAARQAQSKADTYQRDIHELIRLVDYFVSHPAEYAEWKSERVS